MWKYLTCDHEEPINSITHVPDNGDIMNKSNDKKSSKKAKKTKQIYTEQHADARPKLKTRFYEKELRKMQIELVKLQEWVKQEGLKVVVLFEGRDAAGKGGVIKRITQSLNPRSCRVVALGTPTEREKTQWYFQRYVANLPAAGEMVLFDRSWYNRAGVERVMGFCTDDEYSEYLRSCPEFERWKLSPMDLKSREKWVEYSKAKDRMFAVTDTKQCPWYVVHADDKKRARLNCIAHLLSLITYKDLTPEPIKLPPRQDDGTYVRPPMMDQTFVPEIY
jgi:polyphosphate kinase 2 (PPK2 family)